MTTYSVIEADNTIKVVHRRSRRFITN